jgi:hypothetical protein
MNQNVIKNWIIVSFGIFVLGYVVAFFDPDPSITFWLRFLGILSSIFAVGYYVTSPTTLLGKLSYAGVIFMTFGIAFKILHWTGADELIIGGLALFAIPFAIAFFRSRANSDESHAK